MTIYWLSVYVHLVSVILAVGLALFWTVMVLSLRHLDRVEARRLLRLLNTARWPHVAVPAALRLPLPLVAWALIAVVAFTGFVAIYVHDTPGNPVWSLKMWLFVASIAIQVLLLRYPTPPLIYSNLALLLSMVVTSALMVR